MPITTPCKFSPPAVHSCWAALLAPGFFSSAQDAKPATNYLLSVYAAYNNVSGEKSIHNDPSVGHTNTPKASEAMRHGVLEHVKAQAVK